MILRENLTIMFLILFLIIIIAITDWRILPIVSFAVTEREHRDRQTDRDRQADRQTETERQTDRQTETERQRQKQRERERDLNTSYTHRQVMTNTDSRVG